VCVCVCLCVCVCFCLIVCEIKPQQWCGLSPSAAVAPHTKVQYILPFTVCKTITEHSLLLLTM